MGQIAELQNYATYKELSWEGSFEDYLDLVRKTPQVTRNAYQRLYDMVLSHGIEEYIDNKKKLVRYNFFKDEQHGGRDAVFGLDIPLMRLMNVLKSAAQGYGTEQRVILLHGPVGSSKSTIARLLKKGIEEYSRTTDGALYTFDWTLPGALPSSPAAREVFPSPDARRAAAPDPARLARQGDRQARRSATTTTRCKIDGDVNPACRLIFKRADAATTRATARR